jgi:hypothetical protein
MVGRCDCPDDGEAEAVSVPVVDAGRVETSERLEEVVDFIGGDDRSCVGDCEDGVAVDGIRRDVDAAAG